jgi:hypothetical protein
MKALLSVALVAALLVPSVALGAGPTPTLAEQFNAANAMMQGTASDPSSYFATYAQKMIEGLDGTWTTIGFLNYTQDNPDLLAKACQKQSITVAVEAPFAIKLTHNAGTDDEFASTYTSNGGNLFGVSTPPGPLLHRMGLDQGKMPIDASLRVISNSNGIATILRPSPDILIIQTNYGYPTVLGRCPK